MILICYRFERFHRRSPQRVTVHGHSMFRLVDRPLSFRQRANEWIYKMLFLWSKEPAADPRTSPWFAWFATAVILWRCRRRITKAILAVSPFRLLKRRMLVALLKGKTSSVVMKPMRTTTMTNMATTTTTATATTMTTNKMKQQQLQLKQQHGILLGHYCNRQLQQLQEHNCKTTTGIKTRVKRLCTGDGPHVSPSSSSTQTNHQINYRVTRSGRIYGKYHNRIVSTELR
ncbi:uncharacterized protein LOC124427727 isoform X2 [Vespa crabro]|uniref:uncharacterized protein LOC124427727 isoform X2 n=1 Tax=Vespa crabro TaxID=7445 RepID=UPI001EFF80CC|nr:uncharacterized protein LOC124427727 isoform X2 [Vespa crabro]XP_046826950.1 uncharacterized protein LOC124427727 isoform X2 [Vespa crabro]